MSESQPAGCLKALAGLFLIFVVHVPRLIYNLLRLSYAAVFHNRPNLTASPKEHLRRATRLLRRRRNSELLYAALEVRFAVERMAQNEVFWGKVPNRARKNPDPVKKLKALHRADPKTKRPHRFWMRFKGERWVAAEYEPLDVGRVNKIKGRLGDLLHPKVGLPLGVPDSDFYVETRQFLEESIAYLSPIAANSSPYAYYEGLPNVEQEELFTDRDDTD